MTDDGIDDTGDDERNCQIAPESSPLRDRTGDNGDGRTAERYLKEKEGQIPGIVGS